MTDWTRLVSSTEAEIRYNKAPGTFRKAVQQGKFKPLVDCKRFNTQWVVDVAALEREWGNK